MIQKYLHERCAMEIGKLGDFANNADVPKFFDGFTVLAILVTDQHHSVYRQLRGVQGRKRQ